MNQVFFVLDQDLLVIEGPQHLRGSSFMALMKEFVSMRIPIEVEIRAFGAGLTAINVTLGEREKQPEKE